MKKLVPLITSVFVAAACGGCGSVRNTESSQEVSVIKIIKPDYIPEFTDVVNDFCEENTDVQVRFVDAPLSSGERHQLYVSALDGNDTSIDLYWINDEWTDEFVGEGYIIPLDIEPDSGSGYIVDAASMFSCESRLYALPVGLDMDFIFYRTDIADEVPETWEEIIEKCSEPAAEGRIPVCIENSDAQDMLFNIIQIKNARGCSYREAIVMYKEIVTNYYSKDNATSNYSLEFKTGNGVMLMGKASLWYKLSEKTSAVKGNTGMKQLPADRDGNSVSMLCGYGLAINANSENVGAAERFLDFLNSDEEMMRLSRDCNIMPVIESLYDDDMVLDANPYMKNIKETVKNADWYSSYHISGESYRLIEKAFLQYFHDNKTAEETGALLESLLK